MNKMLGTLALLLMCTAADAADRYVRSGASGSGTGADWTNAYTTLPGTLVRGDTYYIADGTYAPYVFDDAQNGTTLITVKKATNSEHGTSTGWSDTYGDGEAVVTGNARLWYFTQGYYYIDGVVGSGKSPGGFGFRLYSTASRCSGQTMSEFAASAGGITLRHIEWDWNNGTASCAQDAPVMLGAWGQQHNNILIEHTYWHHAPAYVFYAGAYPGTQVHSNWTVRNNYFHMIGGGGGVDAHWELFWWMNIDNSVIADNVYEDCFGSTAAQTGWVMIARTDNLTIRGNTFFCTSSANCSIGGNGVVATWSSDNYRNTNINIYNNTFANLSGGYGPKIYFVHNSVDDLNITVQNNLYFNSAFSWTGVDLHSHEACGGGQSCAGSSPQTGIASSIFVNYASKDLRLASATTAGLNLGAPHNLDPLGVTRAADGTWDRGAYEFNVNILPNPPTDIELTELGRRLWWYFAEL